MRRSFLLVSMAFTLFLVGACQALSGVGDLEFVDNPDGAAAAGGSAGTAGSSGSAGSGATGGTGASGGSAGAAGTSGTGGAPGCADATQCPGTDDECGTRTCENQICGIDPTPQGTVVTAQTAGDCKVRVCDGQGGIEEQNDDADVADDGKECTTDGCEAGVPKHTNKAANTSCGTGGTTKCDGLGACVGCVTDGDCAPDTQCTDWSCNTGGTCVESPKSSTTPCGPAATCSGGVVQLQDFCNGSGACQDSGAQTCSPYLCGTSACQTTCDPGTPNSCASGYYCATGQAGSGSCELKLANGAQCSSSAACQSGFCVDGVCCESACTGLCRACSSAKQGGGIDGVCLKVASFTDPDSECAGGRVCNNNTTSPGCTGVIQCNCNNAVLNPNEACCTTCGQSECPSQINTCNAQHGTYCTNIGNIDGYGSGTGVNDASCPNGKRCGLLTCTCVQ